jgi:hypothetical protein
VTFNRPFSTSPETQSIVFLSSIFSFFLSNLYFFQIGLGAFERASGLMVYFPPPGGT